MHLQVELSSQSVNRKNVCDVRYMCNGVNVNVG